MVPISYIHDVDEAFPRSKIKINGSSYIR